MSRSNHPAAAATLRQQRSGGTLAIAFPEAEATVSETAVAEATVAEATVQAADRAVSPPLSSASRAGQSPAVQPATAVPGPPPPATSLPTHSRFDVITGQWTLFASSRHDRPNEFTTLTSGPATAVDCPFCAGNEDQTPPTVLAVDENALPLDVDRCDGRWSIRVIPNRFPAVEPLPASDAQLVGEARVAGGAWVAGGVGDVQRSSTAGPAAQSDPLGLSSELLFSSRPSYGGHEVFIESPSHDAPLNRLDLAQVTSLMRVYQQRVRHWSDQPGIRYVSLFKNVGPAAGASLHHPHSQLIALDRLPQAVRLTSDRMRRHHARTGCCLQCEVVRAELKARSRIVAITDSLVAYCPFASHLPMLLRVTTRRHLDRFEDLDERELDELARLIRRSVGWLQTLYPEAAYNYLFNTKPVGMATNESYHWSFELFPRLTSLAGFEWSCDTMINPVLPEMAASQFRSLAQQENPMR